MDIAAALLSLSSCYESDSVSIDDSRHLSFFNLSAFQRCAVTVELNACDDAPRALYFNIQEADLAPSAFVTIWQLDSLSNASVPWKQISGRRNDGNINPRSVGQFMTTAVRRPRVRLVYQTAEDYQKNQVILTWNTVYNGTPSSDGHTLVFCSALNGYVNRDLLCGQTQIVVCPSRFVANVNEPNAVKAMDLRQCEDKDEMLGIFEERFLTSKLNTSKWNVADYLDAMESVHATPENVHIKDGHLTLSILNSDGRVTVGRLNTTGKFQFLYGQVEIRAKIPQTQYLLTWTSFNLVRANCGADCQECIQIASAWSDFPRHTDAGLFIPLPGKPLAEDTRHNSHMTEDFHVYGLSWTETAVKWYVDEQEVFRVEATDTPHFPRYFAELVIYTSAANQTGMTATELLIDYIVVRQRKRDAIEMLPVLSTTTSVPAWVWTSVAVCLGFVAAILGTVCLVKRTQAARINRLFFFCGSRSGKCGGCV